MSNCLIWIERECTFLFRWLSLCSAALLLLSCCAFADWIKESDYVVGPPHLEVSLLRGLSWKSWLNRSWLYAAWQELRVQKSTSRIEKFVTESVRKSLSQAIKNERTRAPTRSSGPHCLVNLNLPAFVLAPSWTMSWLQGWAAAVREVEREKRVHRGGNR